MEENINKLIHENFFGQCWCELSWDEKTQGYRCHKCGSWMVGPDFGTDQGQSYVTDPWWAWQINMPGWSWAFIEHDFYLEVRLNGVDRNVIVDVAWSDVSKSLHAYCLGRCLAALEIMEVQSEIQGTESKGQVRAC